jgi:hypothetical protein
MLEELNSWIFRSPLLRRTLIKALRMFLRVQRSTLANAVLVVRRPDGHVLALPSASGQLALPRMELDGRQVVPSQVEEWLTDLLRERQTPKLVSIEGTPGRGGVTFLFKADISASQEQTDGIWIDDDAAAMLDPSDRKRLLSSQG